MQPSNYTTFLDGLFSICYPRYMSIAAYGGDFELFIKLSAYSAVVWIQFSAFFSAVVHRRSSLIQFLAFFSAVGRSGSSSIWFSNHFSAVVVWFSNFFSTVIWVSQTSSQLDVVHHRAGFLRPICSVQIYSSSDRSN
ncbi:hypothetical protein LWI29_009699 [Acer saccharum]|uniref:Uncharacterized protein n=1 Tax=Acer saccharum TaxID=4024 RepID=A0AA39SUK8_ACESA|nr:hypothetical protein LWI29_009699 [Acer saccharum]